MFELVAQELVSNKSTNNSEEKTESSTIIP